jgi:hypothetical protein
MCFKVTKNDEMLFSITACLAGLPQRGIPVSVPSLSPSLSIFSILKFVVSAFRALDDVSALGLQSKKH